MWYGAAAARPPLSWTRQKASRTVFYAPTCIAHALGTQEAGLKFLLISYSIFPAGNPSETAGSTGGGVPTAAGPRAGQTHFLWVRTDQE